MNGLNGLVQEVLAFTREHQAWTTPIVFLLAFGESLAFISLLVPATVILLGFGGVIGAGDLNFWPPWIAAALGAACGDWLSYWLARRYGEQIARVWPLSRYPDLLLRGHRFFERWGILGVFLGRFFGPLRATVPLAAGMCDMPQVPFQLANFASAFLWAMGILAPGSWGIPWLTQVIS